MLVEVLSKYWNIKYSRSMRIMTGCRYSAGIPAVTVGSHHDIAINLKKATRTDKNSDTNRRNSVL